MSNYSFAGKNYNKSGIKNSLEAQKSLTNYIKQLKFHFELNDEDVVKILKSILESKKKGGN